MNSAPTPSHSRPSPTADGDAGPSSSAEKPVQRRRRRRVAVTAIAALVLVGGVGAVLPLTPAMPVKGISVAGEVNVSEDDVVGATRIVEGIPIGRVNVKEAASGVAALPWVKSVTVRRDWPSTIGVEVEEYVAVAFVERPDGAHLIDANGREFTVDAPPPGAVRIIGSAEEDDEGRAKAVEVVSALSDTARVHVMAIEGRGPNMYVLRLADDRTVIRGAAEDNANKALAFETVIQREGREFNVSNPALITVR